MHGLRDLQTPEHESQITGEGQVRKILQEQTKAAFHVATFCINRQASGYVECTDACHTTKVTSFTVVSLGYRLF
jgi:hypothetical protein